MDAHPVLPLSCSSEKASEAVEDKAEAPEAKKDEEQEEDEAVDWWGGATSWMSSTVSSVSQVRQLLSFQYTSICYCMS